MLKQTSVSSGPLQSLPRAQLTTKGVSHKHFTSSASTEANLILWSKIFSFWPAIWFLAFSSVPPTQVAYDMAIRIHFSSQYIFEITLQEQMATFLLNQLPRKHLVRALHIQELYSSLDSTNFNLLKFHVLFLLNTTLGRSFNGTIAI